MNFHLSKEELSVILDDTKHADLSIPNRKRTEILSNPHLINYLDSIKETAETLAEISFILKDKLSSIIKNESVIL